MTTTTLPVSYGVRPTATAKSCQQPRQWTRTRSVQVLAAQQDNIFLRAAVSSATEVLRLLGVGQQRYESVAATPAPVADVAPGDIDALLRYIRQDFEQRQYIITGLLTRVVYSEDCYFGDPTVGFSGVARWERNLQLLVPFLDQPSLELLDLRPAGTNAEQQSLLKSKWRLKTYLRFPWRPLIDVIGTTEYTLDSTASKVVRHMESWNVSGAEAVGQIFKPSRQQGHRVSGAEQSTD